MNPERYPMCSAYVSIRSAYVSIRLVLLWM
jgi:hypothetical protein